MLPFANTLSKKSTTPDVSYCVSGFTLAELAIVLLIVGLLLAGLLTPLATQVDIKRTNDTQKMLDDVKEALIGFVVANGRFPCPANAASAGTEAFAPPGGSAVNGNCANFYDGFVPAATLGIGPTDGQGFAIDAWGLQQNRIRYAVATITLNDKSGNPLPNVLTRTGGIATVGINALAPPLPAPAVKLLLVCPTSSGINKPGLSCGAVKLTDTAPAVIYSVGANAATSGGIGADEGENPNPQGGAVDAFYVSHTKAPSTAPGGEFDDIVTWISLNTVFSRMIAAGQLP